MAYHNSEYLVEPEWLEERLSDSSLRILDCRVSVGMTDTGDYEFGSVREAWQAGHIPGASYVDFVSELSDGSSDLPFMLPPAAAFSEVMSRHGVDPGTRVVVYDGMFNIWATRMWWMLRAYGFTNVAVLNGGMARWTREERELSTGSADSAEPPRGNFVARSEQKIFVDKDTVLRAIGDETVAIIDALEPGHYTGESPTWVSRPGHIESAANLPYVHVVDLETHRFLPPEKLRSAIDELDLYSQDGVITYCHAAVAASCVAFALALMGVKNVSIYDGSLREWTADPSLPMETTTPGS